MADSAIGNNVVALVAEGLLRCLAFAGGLLTGFAANFAIFMVLPFLSLPALWIVAMLAPEASWWPPLFAAGLKLSVGLIGLLIVSKVGRRWLTGGRYLCFFVGAAIMPCCMMWGGMTSLPELVSGLQ